jgi:ankyrin repeat protein
MIFPAEVNLNTYYEKPLQQSAQRNLDTVRLLVEHGADDEERDYAWNTPLHMAAARGKTDVVRFLVERWTEGKEALNNHGKTPLSRFEEFHSVTRRRRRLLRCWAARTLRPIMTEGADYCFGKRRVRTAFVC